MAQDGATRLPTPVSPQRDNVTKNAKEGTRRQLSQGSVQLSPDRKRNSRTILDQPEVRLQEAPVSPVSISPARVVREPEAAQLGGVRLGGGGESMEEDSLGLLPIRSKTPNGHPWVTHADRRPHSRASSGASGPPRIEEFGPREDELLQYDAQIRASSSGAGSENRQHSHLLAPARPGLSRPASTYTLASDPRGRTLSPNTANGSNPGSPRIHARDISSSRRSPSSRPLSYIALLSNIPYNQQVYQIR